MTAAIIIIEFTLALFFTQDKSDLQGIWRLKSYDAIENIKSSPGYLFAEEEARKILNARFETILEKGQYEFLKDTLWYTDMDGNDIIVRRALWKQEGETIFINEIDRDFKREATLRYLDSDSLVISPVIYGETSDANMIFTKETDPSFSFVK